jgi:signal transduction histidine kinase
MKKNWIDHFCKSNLNGANLANSEYRVFKISVIIFLQSIAVCFLFSPLHYIAGGARLLIYSLTVAAFGIFSLYLMKYEKYRIFSRLLFITVCNLMIVFNGAAVGFKGGLQYFYAVTMSLPFYMFTSAHGKKSIIYSIGLPIFLGVYTVAFHSNDLPGIVMKDGYVLCYQVASTISTLLMLAFSTFYFHSTIESNEENIENKNTLLFQSEKMVSLGILASGIAHEINNPLTVIKLSVTNFNRYLEDNKTNEIAPEELVLRLSKISQMTDRISKIVTALKSYTRNSTNDPLIKISISKIINESLILIYDEIKSNEIELIYDHTHEFFVLGREGEMVQVIINLLKNSIDAIKNNDNKWVKIEVLKESGYCVLKFSDSGISIDKQVQQNFFQPFFTTKNIGEGTGLGLYISRNLIESMNGTITYEAQNLNTTFAIKLKKIT